MKGIPPVGGAAKNPGPPGNALALLADPLDELPVNRHEPSCKQSPRTTRSLAQRFICEPLRRRLLRRGYCRGSQVCGNRVRRPSGVKARRPGGELGE